LWAKDDVPGWEKLASTSTVTIGAAKDGGIWCSACKKGFSKETVYEPYNKAQKSLAGQAISAGTARLTTIVAEDA
jgi:splicing factor 3A subunit 3